MKIAVKLIAIVGRPASPQGADGETVIELAQGATPVDALAALDLPPEETYVTLVNGEMVPPEARAGVRLADNDVLTVFPPLKGG